MMPCSHKEVRKERLDITDQTKLQFFQTALDLQSLLNLSVTYLVHTCSRRPVEVPMCATVLFSMMVTSRDVSKTSVICLLKRSTR